MPDNTSITATDPNANVLLTTKKAETPNILKGYEEGAEYCFRDAAKDFKSITVAEVEADIQAALAKLKENELFVKQEIKNIVIPLVKTHLYWAGVATGILVHYVLQIILHIL
jgi:hypothetical protein